MFRGADRAAVVENDVRVVDVSGADMDSLAKDGASMVGLRDERRRH